MMKHRFIETGIIMIGFSLISIVTTMITNDLIHVIMIWNIWLSAVVYLLAVFAQTTTMQKISLPLFIVYMLLWLVMFPNSFYVITDILHITPYEFYVDVGYFSFVFVEDITMYVALAHLVMTMLVGIYFGYQSLILTYKALVKRHIKLPFIVYTLVISFLSSIGIAIGRFFRFNSWDIILPWRIIQALWQDWSMFYTYFTLLFIVLHVILIYGLYYMLQYREDH